MSDRLQEIERAIVALGEGTPEYHDALAFYCMTMARAQWGRADIARRVIADSARRRESATRRKSRAGA